MNTQNVTISNITLRNITGVSSGVLNDAILFKDIMQTVTVIDQLYAYEIEISGRALINSVQESNQIKNSTIESINISSSDYLINVGLVKFTVFHSCIISSIKTTDETNTNSAVLLIKTLHLNSELDTTIQDMVIDDCKISFLVLSTIINEVSYNKSISFSNINFTNTHFDNDRAILLTNGI